MINLLTIEWLKLKNYKGFWILTGLYYISLLFVCTGVMGFLYWLETKGANFQGITPTIIPFYEFPDIWHNLTYLASFIKIFLAFLVIISITNEYSYRTIRQNIIDGMDKKGFLFSKISLIATFSVVNTLFIGIVGLIMGLIFSSVRDVGSILYYAEFLLAHALELFTFLMFAFLIGLLVKKAGFAIVLIGLYSLIIEPIVSVAWTDAIGTAVVPFLPITAMNHLIRVPFQRYIFMEIQDYVAWKDIAIVVGWAITFTYLSYLTLKKRDL